MYTYKLVLSYIGTAFSGWQIQPNSSTIQKSLNDALKILLKTPTKTIGSSRTDAGVHALCQVAHFKTECKIDCVVFKKALNALLPKTITVESVEEMQETFHALASAKAKKYCYYLHVGNPLPFLEPFVCQINFLDLELLEQSVKYFVGTYDFTTFANVSKDRLETNKTRTIYSIEIEQHHPLYSMTFLGNGFLFKMVRNIVGTLLAVQQNKIKKEDIPTLFEAKDRKRAPMGAKAKGLFLQHVYYSDKIDSKEEKNNTFLSFAKGLAS
jgi:tRNA pseudouridine38-40 synthase